MDADEKKTAKHDIIRAMYQDKCKRVRRTKITKERRTAKESALTAMLNNSRSKS